MSNCSYDTTNLLSDAKKSILKVMKFCYGQLSDQPFRRKLISVDLIINVFKPRFITRFMWSSFIRALLYSVNLMPTKGPLRKLSVCSRQVLL